MKVLPRLSGLMTVMFILALSTSGCDGMNPNTGTRQTSAAPGVGVHTVKPEPVVLSTRLTGRTIALRTAEIRPQINGIIQQRKFEEGAHVSEGEILYQIDPSIYQATYDRAVSNVTSLERTATRKKGLVGTKAISVQEYEDAFYALSMAQADARLAKLNLEYCQISSPISGRIGRSNITEGALVLTGQPQALAVVQQIDPIYVDLNPAVARMFTTGSPTNDDGFAAIFASGSEVTLILENGERYPIKGKIKFVDSVVNAETGTALLRAEFPNPNGVLLPGMYVRAQVTESIKEDGILIPQQALFRDPTGQAYVWVVNEQDRVERKKVEVGQTIGNTWLMTAGLVPGERVVTEGLQRLAEGIQVTPRKVGNLEIKLALGN